ncbi:type I-B CRISPR-associated protein Cas7/Cst2/DevR [Acetivibrio clariflavus]|uniref:CRISPR-associated autoregulator, Cst2 family n=1 Tax=Acetivibrio clariflavus (strain DSM 19732 / NBRC 101661 / EBR45) TaxID=720554 RepID=G8M1H1_ACECE|nr:type I-B CRISPR-associated protein Cas7/Cst2/DevR [Acetivibrio clariflavus]AEV69186.1 CRISPR-associated autoregulator, Cst2 family [Acetivibrio clariflavus DSM 19732]
MIKSMKPKGLIISMIFEAESANYGEGIGNVASLKKMARGNGDQYTYISRQALRYNIIEQLNEPIAEVKAEGSGDKKVIQFAPDATIKDYPEIDFFGYMKTKKGEGSATRTAKVRLSNAISLETFKGDLDFLTNKGLADRLNENMNIAQSEIHRSYYRYTVTADLEQIGIDEGDNIFLENSEKARRVNKLLDTISLLYRDIRGRREDLKPLFAIGGVYDVKNPIFQNALEVKDNRLIVSTIEGVLFDSIKKDTFCGLIEGKFSNDGEIKEKLNAVSMPEFFNILKRKVSEYYESC